MVIRDVNLETVCGITSTIPENPYREVAFAGKSNVGKSSLINALLNRKALARTSSQPGKTQTINFYNVNNALYLVDLPGYGYASASVEIKAKWGKMIENYLHVSKMLAAVFLLVDIRHAPSDNDRMMYEWMVYQGFSPIIIATKLDKINRSQIEKHLSAIREGLATQPDTRILPFSAETKQGRDEIWALIEELTMPEDIKTAAAGDSKTVGMERAAGKTGSSKILGTGKAAGKTGSSKTTGTEKATGKTGSSKISEMGKAAGKNRNSRTSAKRIEEAELDCVGNAETKKKPRWKSIGRENPSKVRKSKKEKRTGKKK